VSLSCLGLAMLGRMGDQGGVMREIVVERERLLQRLDENRERHAREYAEAHEMFRVAVIARLREMAEQAQAGGAVETRVGIEEPHSYVAEYDVAIDLFGMDVRAEVPLDEREARKYLRDEWEWRAHFAATLRGVGYYGDHGEMPAMTRAS
jgi:hypothetical protein